MPPSRNAFRYPVDLNAWFHPSNGPAAPARVIDLSRRGAGILIGLPLESSPLHDDLTAPHPNPSTYLVPGQPLRLAVVDVVEGQRITQQWNGRLTHAGPAGPCGERRLGVAFDPAPEFDSPARAVAPGIDWLLQKPADPRAIPMLASTVALLGLVADQFSKSWAWSLTDAEPAASLPLFADLLAVTPVANTGTVASLAHELPHTATLCALSALGVAALAPYWALPTTPSASAEKSDSRLAAISGGLLISGLIGNATDRLALGFVRDFLTSACLPDWAFNLADVFLVTGALGLLVSKLIASARPSSAPSA